MAANRLAVLATVPPADTARMGMLLDYVSAACAMDYDVLVFLALDSVLLVKKQVFEKLDDSIKQKFKRAVELGVKFVACSSAVQGFGVKEFINDGVEVWGVASFFDFASNSKLTLSI
ncbi:MAG: DsrE family protein [Nitrososphaerota archaeon]|jgi:predicted peroxiredoxin|nr:DsrE family protein [Nitrososphaerota archaeon]MDG6928063.1 DsrE family protein [Nitrososphaerota archaeon]MDG6930154.1 DsrE family protein [Nitrososphaerota archaeon]MDG6931667.1 DsrE family protein [Nitrososphaerota archaeon]MDG6936258.1 DsrE family protein [Nitrososphaerota archaeon]